MTPLAFQLAKDLTLARCDRRVQDQVGLKYRLDGDLHCFECSELGDVIQREMEACGGGSFELCNELLPRTFLPSPRTWIEMGFSVGNDDSKYVRMGFWLEQPAGPGTEIRFSHMLGKSNFDDHPAFTFDRSPIRLRTAIDRDNEEHSTDRYFNTLVLLTLALINESGMVLHRREKPHKGLQKSLDRVMPGQFSLQAWHTVKLPPRRSEETGEHHASASRCLHFVRAHLRKYRVRANGATVHIPAHWRGDPALGIKQTRYEVLNSRA